MVKSTTTRSTIDRLECAHCGITVGLRIIDSGYKIPITLCFPCYIKANPDMAVKIQSWLNSHTNIYQVNIDQQGGLRYKVLRNIPLVKHLPGEQCPGEQCPGEQCPGTH